jgi:hypothetical protein
LFPAVLQFLLHGLVLGFTQLLLSGLQLLRQLLLFFL